MKAASRPLASLSLDLDNKWSYLKTHGDGSWQSFPSYLDVLVPRLLDFLRSHGLTITVFVVGQDAALPVNREPLRSLAQAGHEIGNHSFKHEPWLHLYSESEIEEEIRTAEESIQEATGRRPLGFRGPGFSLSLATLRTLVRRGYLYDASTFPTFLGPLARAYYFMSTRMSRAERKRRKALFGSLRDGLRPLKPYRFRTEAGEILEVPVTTLPLLRSPIHASYILYLSSFSPALARLYFRTAVEMCRLTSTPFSLLLHPLDFLGGDDVSDLAFFPGMRLPGKKKLEVLDGLLRAFSTRFTVMTMEGYARETLQRSDLRALEPKLLKS